MKDRIREMLLARAGLKPQDIDSALRIEEETGQTLDRILINKGLVEEEKCLRFFGEILGIAFRADISGVAVPPDFIQSVPVQFARNFNLVAIERNNGVVKVATC